MLKELFLKRNILFGELAKIQGSIDYIDWKQIFYNDVLSEKTKYYSNLTKANDET